MRTRACGLIIREGRVLLQRKRNEMIWALPGGRVEVGETPEAALIREFREELGWDVHLGSRLWEFVNVFSHEGVDIRQAEVCFAIASNMPLTIMDETLEFRWVSPSEFLHIDVRPYEIRNRIFQNQ
jgi:8-oxo-dGTP pyrophosphatase MutT (NUDIX family)